MKSWICNLCTLSWYSLTMDYIFVYTFCSFIFIQSSVEMKLWCEIARDIRKSFYWARYPGGALEPWRGRFATHLTPAKRGWLIWVTQLRAFAQKIHVTPLQRYLYSQQQQSYYRKLYSESLQIIFIRSITSDNCSSCANILLGSNVL